MDEVLRAKGSLVLRAPAAMRFTLAEPERVTIAADGANVRVLDAKGTALPLPSELAGLAAFARTLTSLLLGGERPERFDERWDGPDVVTLTPRDPAAPFGTIRLRFPSASPLPDEIVLDERGGDRTTIRLSGVKVDAESERRGAAR
jgi:outer membrane lipoprotein-sorting protein